MRSKRYIKRKCKASLSQLELHLVCGKRKYIKKLESHVNILAFDQFMTSVTILILW